jgi:hypothetical protein
MNPTIMSDKEEIEKWALPTATEPISLISAMLSSSLRLSAF